MTDNRPDTPIPAATVVIFRDGGTGPGMPPEILMVERSRTLAFAGGALVFPGGRVDVGDVAYAAALDGPAYAAAKVAAVRETIEEVGLPLGLTPAPTAEALRRMRRDLHDGVPIAQVLAAAGVTLDLAMLAPFARWLPAHSPVRTFDTLFFLALSPAGFEPTVDATENVRLLWAPARDILGDADAGRATIIYPTRRNLERLALFASYEDALADAAAHPIDTITPFIEDRDGKRFLCIPDGLGYPVTAEEFTRAMRG